eukprot:3011965-Rhodomonas_salina.2
MAATNESHDHELVTKGVTALSCWPGMHCVALTWRMVLLGLPIAQLPMSASVERMARNYQASLPCPRLLRARARKVRA